PFTLPPPVQKPIDVVEKPVPDATTADRKRSKDETGSKPKKPESVPEKPIAATPDSRPTEPTVVDEPKRRVPKPREVPTEKLPDRATVKTRTKPVASPAKPF